MISSSTRKNALLLPRAGMSSRCKRMRKRYQKYGIGRRGKLDAVVVCIGKVVAPKILKHFLAGVLTWLVGVGRLEVLVVMFGIN